MVDARRLRHGFLERAEPSGIGLVDVQKLQTFATFFGMGDLQGSRALKRSPCGAMQIARCPLRG